MKQNTVKLKIKGAEILSSPLINKGTAFTKEERDLLELNGLLPPHISTAEEQIKRNYLNFSSKRTPLEKYDALMGLMSRNELLFYQFVLRYASEMLPIVYTPTVGDAAIQYSRAFIHQRGLYLSYELKDQLEEIFSRYHRDEIDVIVVTDGERILGLGDLGIGGMSIPIGKLALYTLFGGIHPAKTLPIILDVGTNNEELLNDELYLGAKHKRLRGEQYDDFINLFIKAVKKRYPNVLLQWEDFGKNNARRLLDMYRQKILSFNDDIQGTAAVSLGAILAAVKQKNETLQEQTVAILGGGSAGTGIADILVKAMMEEGISEKEAQSKIFIVDIHGLIHFNTKHVEDSQKAYSHSQKNLQNWDIHSDFISFEEVIKNAKPTILIGVSAQAGAFTEEIIKQMHQNTKRPIIFPLSNPTSKAECTPQEAIQWTQGDAIIAAGSPFQPVVFNDKKYQITQCNNVYIFPGLGLGALASKASEITDSMFIEAAKCLALHSPAIDNPLGSLLPAIHDVRKVSKKIAIAVAKKAIEEKVSKLSIDDVEKEIEAHVWEPSYPRYII